MADGSTTSQRSRPSDDKPRGYYANARPDLVASLPRPLGRALDVGCGAGAVGELLLAQGANWVTGIEVNETAAAIAAERLNEVLVGPVEQMLPKLTGAWDTICCYDVLEHLVDPEQVLLELAARAAGDGRLHVSVPNARHVSLVADLVLRGTFGYTEWGHRDSTHLRWFTRRDIVALVGSSGWRVLDVSHPVLGRSAPLARITGGRSTEFLVGQWYVLAERV
jgi:2-polyprenyl-3-methyl-5-hydroxy-6-metoxy-1,4-benzoquinol methylase